MRDVAFYNALPFEADRITINSGCDLFVGSLQGYECPKNTYLPKEDWRLINNDEENVLLSNESNSNVYQQIGIVSLPQDIVNQLNALGISKINNIKEGNALKSRHEVKQLLDDIESYCKRFQIVNEPQIGIGLIYKDAVSVSATYDKYVSSYIGLHLDSWEHDTIINRNFSRNRICFNLGEYDRYITFCNLSLSKIHSMICAHDLTIKPRDLAKSFLQTMSNYPILKLKIKPYEGYIFPTENLIHDGRCSVQAKLDITYTLRSYYSANCSA